MNRLAAHRRPRGLTRWAALVALGSLALTLSIPVDSSAATPTGGRSAPTLGPAAAAYPAALARFYTQKLTWTRCDAGSDCSWLTVPRDYADPTGPTIRLRLSRVFASTDARLGSLVVNPGGPGASGVEFADYVATAIAPDVSARYDIVGFDTRGVGRSAPITCMTGRQTTRWLANDGSPDTRAEQDRLWALAGRLGRGCLSMSPRIARHVGSDNTIRDMDILRASLGDPALNFLGFSYGTFLGTLYAQEFPDQVGRFVLDGALDPSMDAMEVSLGQSKGFQQAMGRFAADCGTRPTCPVQGSEATVLRSINRLLARLDRRPMAVSGGGHVVQADALSALFYAMYSPEAWPMLRSALKEAEAGNGAGLQFLSDYANERTGPNSYASNMASAFPAISCWDTPAPPGRSSLAAAATAWSRGVKVPDMARAMAWGNAPCSQWYGHASRVPAAASTTTTAPILVIGSTYDPATPYAWAVALSEQLSTSTLLTRKGDGHTAYGTGSACVDAAVDAYLLTGTMPAAGTVCR